MNSIITALTGIFGDGKQFFSDMPKTPEKVATDDREGGFFADLERALNLSSDSNNSVLPANRLIYPQIYTNSGSGSSVMPDQKQINYITPAVIGAVMIILYLLRR